MICMNQDTEDVSRFRFDVHFIFRSTLVTCFFCVKFNVTFCTCQGMWSALTPLTWSLNVLSASTESLVFLWETDSSSLPFLLRNFVNTNGLCSHVPVSCMFAVAFRFLSANRLDLFLQCPAQLCSVSHKKTKLSVDAERPLSDLVPLTSEDVNGQWRVNSSDSSWTNNTK